MFRTSIEPFALHLPTYLPTFTTFSSTTTKSKTGTTKIMFKIVVTTVVDISYALSLSLSLSFESTVCCLFFLLCVCWRWLLGFVSNQYIVFFSFSAVSSHFVSSSFPSFRFVPSSTSFSLYSSFYSFNLFYYSVLEWIKIK